MNTKSKSAALLIVTLLLGILLGAIGSSTLHNQRLEELRSLRSKGGFMSSVEEVIAPKDENQRAQIRAVLERSQASLEQVSQDCRHRFKERADSMHAALAPLLSEQQVQRLEEWMSRDRGFGRRQGERGRQGKTGPPGR